MDISEERVAGFVVFSLFSGLLRLTLGISSPKEGPKKAHDYGTLVGSGYISRTPKR